MRNLSETYGLQGVLAPVRPNRKHECSEESIESYADRRDELGRLWDPWLRVHEELGGERLGITLKTVSVIGSIKDWESWTGMQFPVAGSYSIPDGLVPITIEIKERTMSPISGTFIRYNLPTVDWQPAETIYDMRCENPESIRHLSRIIEDISHLP